jgi:hypothetical protein
MANLQNTVWRPGFTMRRRPIRGRKVGGGEAIGGGKVDAVGPDWRRVRFVEEEFPAEEQRTQSREEAEVRGRTG